MIEIDQKQLEKSITELDDVTDSLDNAVSRGSKDSIYRDIENEVNKAIISPILRRAMELGEPHVGDRVVEIEPVKGRWRDGEYVAGLRSDNTVVLSHEFGSGQYRTTGKYRITPNSDGPLAFEVDGVPIHVEFVKHPGVRGKRFMQRAIREQMDEIEENALDEMQQTLHDALDT